MFRQKGTGIIINGPVRAASSDRVIFQFYYIIFIIKKPALGMLPNFYASVSIFVF